MVATAHKDERVPPDTPESLGGRRPPRPASQLCSAHGGGRSDIASGLTFAGGVEMPRPLAPCGTAAAYRRHKLRGEKVEDGPPIAVVYYSGRF